MLRISKRSEYALMALQCMANAPGQEIFSVEAIASHAGLPRGLLAKVMQALRRADILASSKGAGGGYMLRRSLTEIELLDVMAIFGDSPDLVSCQHSNGQETCQHAALCTLQDPMAMISARVKASLVGINLKRLFIHGSSKPQSGPLLEQADHHETTTTQS